MGIKNKVPNSWYFCFEKDIWERKYEEELNMQIIHDHQRSELTNAEKEKIIIKWGKIDDTISFEEHEVFKFFHGFDADFLGYELYLLIIARKLNNYHYSKQYKDKNFTDK